jgi:ketoreductase
MAEVGRVALVTGATSGIGLEITRRLAQGGGRAYICGRRADVLEETVRSFRDEGLEVDGRAYDVCGGLGNY